MLLPTNQKSEKSHNLPPLLPENHSVKYSVFTSCKDAYPKQKSGSFDDLADTCQKPAIRDGKDGVAFCPAVFKGHRSNNNAIECGFMAFDLDDLPEEITAVDLLKCIDGLLAFAYSSHNHLMQDKGARFRVVVAVDSSIPADQYPDIVRAFSKRFPWSGAVDDKCFNSSRLFYLPSCAADRVDLFKFERQEGALFDWQEVVNTNIVLPAIKPLKRGSDAFADIPSNLVPAVDMVKLAEALEFIEPEEYGAWLNVGMGLRELHEEGFLMWDKWSMQSDKYTGRAELLKKWASFTSGGGVGLGTIFYLAKQNGFVLHPPVVKHAPAENFSGDEFEMPKAFTELAVAEAIQKTFGGGFHYVTESGKWLVSDGSSGLWVEDSTGQIKRWMFVMV